MLLPSSRNALPRSAQPCGSSAAGERDRDGSRNQPQLPPRVHAVACAIRLFTHGYKYAVAVSQRGCAMCCAVTWSGVTTGTSLGHQTAARLSRGQEGDPFIDICNATCWDTALLPPLPPTLAGRIEAPAAQPCLTPRVACAFPCRQRH